jgi:hypothetical protein
MMKPRLAIVLMLTIGALLMAGGTGLAVSGISSNGDAGIAQYGGGGGEGAGGGPGDAQAARQAAAGDDDLPLTGFAAIPLIVVGVGAMVGGLVLRRRDTTG